MDRYVRSKDSSGQSTTLRGGVEKAGKHTEHGGRSGYFLARQRKVQSQAPKAVTSLFAGCKVYFTCCVSHPQIRLSRLIWENGGIVSGGWSRTNVTHVIADRLAGSKLEKELQSIGRPNAWRGTIVRPDWVTTCVARNELVPTFEYRIVNTGIRNIASMFGNFGSRKGASTVPHQGIEQEHDVEPPSDDDKIIW